jgi:hypothetical protein
MTRRLGECALYVDAAARMVADTLARDYGLTMIASSVKTDRQAQLDRMNDLCATGKMRVAAGSRLDEDMRLTEWTEAVHDPAVVRKYAAGHHPDALDAARYALATVVAVRSEADDPRARRREAARAPGFDSLR